MDGIMGNLIVRQPQNNDPNGNLYDKDLPSHVVLIADWMHEPSDDHLPGLLRENVGQDADSYLVNGRGVYAPQLDPTDLHSYKEQIDFYKSGKPPIEVFKVKKNYRYRFRIIGGTCLSCPFQLWVEGHRLRVIGTEMDSLEPKEVDSVVMAAGERFDFVIDANEQKSFYWILVKGLGACRDAHQVAVLKYEDAQVSRPPTSYPGYMGLPAGVVLNPRNSVCRGNNRDEVCVTSLTSRQPNPNGLLKPKPDYLVLCRFGFYTYEIKELFQAHEYYKFFVPFNPFTNELPILISYINNVSNAFPPSPLLTQLHDVPNEVYCSKECLHGSSLSVPKCECVHLVKVKLGSIVEFIMVDDAEPASIAISHPFHLHGYEMSVLKIGIFGKGDRTTQINRLINKMRQNPITKSNLPRKDTVAVPASGYIVTRIVADNPGMWFLHCHFIYHLETGMSMIFQVGDYENDFPSTPYGFPKCYEYLAPNANPL